MTLRIRLLLVNVSLALTMAGAALLMPVPTPSAVAVAVAPASASVTPEEAPLYQVRAVAGEVCVFHRGKLLRRTGVAVSSLPKEDRLLLETGISVQSEQELASLMEDLCS